MASTHRPTGEPNPTARPSCRAAILLVIAGSVIGLAAIRAYLGGPHRSTAFMSVEDLSAETRWGDVHGELRWIGQWLDQPRRTALLDEVRNDFLLLNRQVHISLTFPEELLGTSDRNVYAQFLADLVRRGQVDWDIVWMDADIYQRVAHELGDPYWGTEHLVDFSQISGFAKTQKPVILDEPWYRQRTGGIIVGPHLEGRCPVLLLNRKLAEQSGWSAGDVQTFSTFVECAESISDNRHHERLPSAVILIDDDPAVLGWLLCYAMQDLDGPGVTADALELLARLGKCSELVDRSEIPGQTLIERVSGGEAIFCMTEFSHAHASFMTGAHGRTVELLAADIWPGSHSNDRYPGYYQPIWAVLQNGPNPEAGIELLLFWSRPRIAERWVRGIGGLTGIATDPGLMRAVDRVNPFSAFRLRINEQFDGRLVACGPIDAKKASGGLDSDPIAKLTEAVLSGEIAVADAARQLTAAEATGPAFLAE